MSSLMRSGGRAEPQVVNVHERDQVAERRGLDHAQLIERRLGIRLFEHANQARQGLDEPRRFLVRLDAVERLGRELALKAADQIMGLPEGIRRDVTFFVFFASLVGDFLEHLLVVDESVTVQCGRPLLSLLSPGSGRW